MAIDGGGFIHVSGNMHGDPADLLPRHARARRQQPPARHRDDRQQRTGLHLPAVFSRPTGGLLFAYRDGASGNGNYIFNGYNESHQDLDPSPQHAAARRRGGAQRLPGRPDPGPDGWYHIVWVWRDTPDAATNHDISYAKSRDLVSWQRADGQAVTLPITLARGDVVDPVPAGGGMINNNTKIGFDSQNRVIVAYHKYDAAGNTQLYNARFEGDRWAVHKTSPGPTRWAFGGQGTLVFEIEVEPVVLQPNGTLTQEWYHAKNGGWGAFRLDETTLAATRDDRAAAPLSKVARAGAVDDGRDGGALGGGQRHATRRRRPLSPALGDAGVEPRHAARSDPPADPPAALRNRRRAVILRRPTEGRRGP